MKVTSSTVECNHNNDVLQRKKIAEESGVLLRSLVSEYFLLLKLSLQSLMGTQMVLEISP